MYFEDVSAMPSSRLKADGKNSCEPKKAHKVIEKERRQRINDRIDDLRAILSELRTEDGQFTKIQVLDLTISTIIALQDNCSDLFSEHMRLEQEQKTLAAALEKAKARACRQPQPSCLSDGDRQSNAAASGFPKVNHGSPSYSCPSPPAKVSADQHRAAASLQTNQATFAIKMEPDQQVATLRQRSPRFATEEHPTAPVSSLVQANRETLAAQLRLLKKEEELRQEYLQARLHQLQLQKQLEEQKKRLEEDNNPDHGAPKSLQDSKEIRNSLSVEKIET